MRLITRWQRCPTCSKKPFQRATTCQKVRGIKELVIERKSIQYGYTPHFCVIKGLKDGKMIVEHSCGVCEGHQVIQNGQLFWQFDDWHTTLMTVEEWNG
jgi:DnaJ-class molecular chaperone